MPDHLAPLERARPTVSQEVAQRLLTHLRSGGVAVGDRLPPERELAATLGVARSAIREATQALGFLGILEVRHGSGTYVRGTSADLLPRVVGWELVGDRDVRDLLETRIAIEVSLAGLAAARAEQDDLGELDQLVERHQAATAAGADAEELVDLGLAFHLKLAETAGNAVMAGMLRQLTDLLRVWTRQLRLADAGGVHVEQHAAVLAACRHRDAAGAEAAMRRHLDSSLARLDRVLGT